MKRLADVLTALRLVLAVLIAWIALTRQDPLAFRTLTWIVIVAFMTDWLDGPIARRIKDAPQTWLGYHDFEFDFSVTVALSITLFQYGLIWPVLVAIALFIGWIGWRTFIAKEKINILETGIWPDHRDDTRDSMFIEAMMAVIDFSFLYLVWDQDPEMFKIVLIWIFVIAILNPGRSLSRVRGFIDVGKRILQGKPDSAQDGDEHAKSNP